MPSKSVIIVPCCFIKRVTKMGFDTWEVAVIRRIIKSGTSGYVTISSNLIPNGDIYVNLLLTPLKREEWGRKIAIMTKRLGKAKVNGSYKIAIPRSILEYLGATEVWIRITDPSITDGLNPNFPYLSLFRNINYQGSVYRVTISKTLMDRLARLIDWSGYIYVALKINGEVIEVATPPSYVKSQNRYYITLPSPAIKKLISEYGDIRTRVIFAPLPRGKWISDYVTLY